MRCFVAILLDDDARTAVAGEVDRLRPLCRAVAWVPAANLHVTLRFLGEQPDAAVDGLVEGLEETARLTPPFTLGLHGVGAFPGLERPRILWVGVAAGALELRALQARVQAALEARGFGREPRPWHPHLTVGRVFDPGRWRREAGPALRGEVARLGTRALADLAVTRIALMRSDLRPTGARHHELRAVTLAAATPARLQ
jgi:2'-5' RNA ligase